MLKKYELCRKVKLVDFLIGYFIISNQFQNSLLCQVFYQSFLKFTDLGQLIILAHHLYSFFLLHEVKGNLVVQECIF